MRAGAPMFSRYCQPHGNVRYQTSTVSVCQLLAYETCDRGVRKGVSFISLFDRSAVLSIFEVVLLFQAVTVCFGVCCVCASV